MSEVDGDGRAGIDAKEMSCPLWFAKRIIEDVNGMKPSAWITWQAIDNHISTNGYMGNKDWCTSSLDGGYWGLAICDHDKKEIIFTKKYYAMGQFTKFIRPGATIIGSSRKSLASYHKKDKQVVVVIVNDSSKDKETLIDLSCFKKTGNSARVIRTSGNGPDSENLKELPSLVVENKLLKVNLLSNSITSIVIDNVQ
jgi:hypothetical protein